MVKRYVRVRLTLEIPQPPFDTGVIDMDMDGYARGYAIGLLTGRVADDIRKVHNVRVLDINIDQVSKARLMLAFDNAR